MITLETMQTRWGAVVLLALVGCGGGCGGGSSAKENKVCEHAAKLCDASDEIASCREELREAKTTMGDRYEKFLDCSLSAKSCGEYVGCAIGGLGSEVLDEIDGVGKGVKKMLKEEDEVDDEALPGPCTRIEKVCAPDEPFIRRECRRLVQNLGEDKASHRDLAACISAANNCFALRDCVVKLERKMKGF